MHPDMNNIMIMCPVISAENETRTMVGGLRPDTEYQFQIAAYTRKGDGARSKSKKIRTKIEGR